MLNNIIDKIKLPFRKDKELYLSLRQIIGFYPHNIFLEVTLETGIIGLMSFMTITIIFLVSCFYFLKRFNGFKTNYLALVLIALYHFLFWNVSHDLSSAYGLLPLMSIVYFKYLEKKKN